MTNSSLNKKKIEKKCKELKITLKKWPFFDVVGGCGVDLSGGDSNCMDKSGVWFNYCPFCGKKILSEYKKRKWNWYEQK